MKKKTPLLGVLLASCVSSTSHPLEFSPSELDDLMDYVRSL